MKARSPSLRSLGAAAAVMLAVIMAAPSFAAVIQGTVLNQNTQRFLERATVQVQGTSLQALTDRDGRFRISGLPAGTYTVVASYAGLDAATATVTVKEETPATLSLELTSDVYQLGEFVVNSTVEGNAYAINQQRRAESARSVTSIDAFIDQVTGNPGEFLRNVSGIQMDFSQNEPQLIRVRGMAPELTTVTMDGNEIASAASSSDNRQLQVDQLSMAAIGAVEVFKAPIPSMSANAIGGAVNFTTKSAFEQKGRRSSLQVGVMMDSHDFHFRKTPGPGHGEDAERRIYPVGRLEYSNSFLDRRLGVVFSVGRDHTNQLASSITHNLNVTALPGSALPAPPTLYTQDNVLVRRGAMSFAPNRQLRTRDDISLNTDFKLTEQIAVFLKTTFSEYHSTNRNHGFTLTPGTLVAGHTVTDYSTTNGTAAQGVSVFDKHTNSWQINPGAKFRSGNWKLDLIGGFSKSTNHYENPSNFTSLSINLPGVGWSMSTPTDTDKPSSIVQTNGPDFYNLGNYVPNQGNLAADREHRTNHAGFVSNNVRHSSEVRYSARLDVQRDFQARYPFYVKAGLSYNETIRDKRQPQRRWYWVGDDGVPGTADDTTAAANLGRFAEPVPVTQGIPGFNLREPTYLSTYELWKYWQANPRVLVENLAYAEEQRFTGKRKVNEAITGAYAMGSVNVARLNVLTGLRIEETEIEATGVRTLPTSGATSVLPAGVHANSIEGVRAKYRFVTTRSDYRSDPFPYLHLRYEWLPNLQTRASYTEAIGRPNFAQILPSMTQNDSAMTVTVNRAGLEPQRSKNLDFSAEYYTRSAGEWTAAWFSRDVNRYISSTRVPMTAALLQELNLGSEFSNYDVVTSTNLGSANWLGYEVGVRQQLRDWGFVPALLHGVTIWANHTRIYEMEGDFGTPGARITHLANVVPKLFNAGISYRTPRGKLFVQLTTNRQSVRPTQNLPAANAAAQRWPRQEPYQFWNLEASYRLLPKLRLTCTARNLFSERPEFSEVGVIRNRQQDTGIAWMFAARYDL